MNLPKAIEILEDIILYVQPGDPPEEHDAINLGIEALKRVQEHPTLGSCFWPHRLPGETVE